MVDFGFARRAAPALVLMGAGACTASWAQTTFTQRELSSNSPQPTSVVVADVDGDGDVVAAEYTANAVVWYQNGSVD